MCATKSLFYSICTHGLLLYFSQPSGEALKGKQLDTRQKECITKLSKFIVSTLLYIVHGIFNFTSM